MNQSNQLSPELIKLFEDYYHNKLSAEQKTTFESNLNSDKTLNLTYLAYLQSREVINEKIESTLRVDLNKWKNEVPKPKVKTISLSYWKSAIAASMIGMISLVAYQDYKINNFIDTQISENLSLYEGATRGENVSNVEKIIADFNQNHNKAFAISELNKITSNNAEYGNAQKKLGYIYVRDGDCKNTQKCLANAYGNNNNDELTLAMILCQIKCNKIDDSMLRNLNAMAADSTNLNHQIASTIQKKISGFWWKLLR